jgi:N-acetylglucosamine-6-phosphate deacetylase
LRTSLVTTIALLASRAYCPDEVAGPVIVVIRDGKIESVSRAEALPAGAVIDLRPWSIAPGYVDLHTHGFAGHDVTTGSVEDIAAMAAALPSTGVTAFYPTVASTAPAETLRQVQSIAAASRATSAASAEMLGVRLEGPYINPKRRGAQYAEAIRLPDVAELQRLVASGPLGIVDFAPELDTDFALLRMLVAHGIVGSIGHTDATYAQAKAAIDAGARHCTHLFNAMPPLAHRAPGCVGALLDDTRATVEVIADGVHLDPTMLRLVVRLRGPEAVALITDALAAAGSALDSSSFVGRQVRVRDGAMRLSDGTLAGSVLTLDAAVRNMVRLAGAAWSDAVRMATQTPASIARVADRKGYLGPGADADLVVLDGDGQVQQTYVRGERVFSASQMIAR